MACCEALAREQQKPEPLPSEQSLQPQQGATSFECLLAAIGQEHARLRTRAGSLEQQLSAVRTANARAASLRYSRMSGGADSMQVCATEELPQQVDALTPETTSHIEDRPMLEIKQSKTLEPRMTCTETGRFAVDDLKPQAMKKRFSSSSILYLGHEVPSIEQLVRSPTFELMSGLVIVLSALLLGLETDHMARHNGTSPKMYYVVNVLINLVFCFEFALRVWVDKASFFYNKDWRWAWLDTVLVACSLIDLCVAFVHINLLVVGRILRLLRLFRLIRTVRLVRAMRSVREFHKMMYAVLSSLRTLMCALLIMTFVVYFFAVLFCQGVMELTVETGMVRPDLDLFYGTLPKAFFTLFAAASTGIDWHEAFSPLAGMHWAYTVGFLVYIALILFGVSNVVTSVFVESAIMSAQHYRELIVQEKQHAKEIAVMHMKEVFRQIDQDGSGEISSDEMEYFLTEPNLKSYIDALGISAEDTRMLFRLMDVDESGQINVDEFCDGCLRLQGEAKSMDVHAMIFQVQRFLGKWSEFTAYVEDRFSTLNILVGGESFDDGLVLQRKSQASGTSQTV